MGTVPPPHEPGVGDGVVGVTERPGGQKRPPIEKAHHAVDLGGLQGFGQRHIGEHRGESLGQHRLAGTRGADHQDVVGPSGRHLQGPLYILLPFDVTEIGVIDGMSLEEIVQVYMGGLESRLPIEEVNHLGQVLRTQDLHLPHHCSFRCIGGRKDKTSEAFRFRSHGHRQGATNGFDLTVEGEFADHEVFLQPVLLHQTFSRQDPHRHGEVITRAFLLDVGRG